MQSGKSSDKEEALKLDSWWFPEDCKEEFHFKNQVAELSKIAIFDREDFALRFALLDRSQAFF